MALDVPLKLLSEVERLTIVARDIFGLENKEISLGFTADREVFADKLGVPVEDIPPAPAHWARGDPENTVSKVHHVASMKLALYMFGEAVLNETEWKIVWARWASGHGAKRVACTVGPDPQCGSRRLCRRVVRSACHEQADVKCGPELGKSILHCFVIHNPDEPHELLIEEATRRVFEIEASSARKILDHMCDMI